MLRTLFKSIILIAWLGSISWLIRYEAFPHVFDGMVHGYRDLSQDLPAMRDSWMQVYAKDQHVGYLNSAVEVEDVDGVEVFIMKTQLVVNVSFQGRTETLRFVNTIRLNSRHELLGSVSRVSVSGISGQLDVSPTGEEEQYALNVSLNEFKLNRMIQIPDEAVISSPLMDQGLRMVEPGQSLFIRSLDPFSMSGELQTIEVKGITREERYLRGETQPVQATLTETHFGELVLRSEVDQFGRVIWQETPFGVTLFLSRPDVAMNVPKENSVDPTELFSASLFTNLPPGGSTP